MLNKCDSKDFEVKIINTLKNEIDCLTLKIQEARESENYGTYRNLIIAYSQILLLIDKYK